MRISSIGSTFNYNRNAVGRKAATPSFGERTGDSFRLDDRGGEISLSKMINSPQTFLRDIHYKSTDRKSTLYFQQAMHLRSDELAKPDMSDELIHLEHMAAKNRKLQKELSIVEDDILRTKLHKKVEQDKTEVLRRYEQTKAKARDLNKVKAYTKICKKMLKSPVFDPNADFMGRTLIEDAIMYNDKEMAIALMRHKDFRRPYEFSSDMVEQKYEALIPEAKGILGLHRNIY